MENPYLDEFQHVHGSPRVRYEAMREMKERYAWAVPDARAIAQVASYSPLIEIGAGAGYWAWLLAQAGADIVAFDKNPPGSARGFFGDVEPWFDVREGTDEAVSNYPDRTLLLCWPGWESDSSARALFKYEGSTFLFVGDEPVLGRTPGSGDPKFWRRLRTEWRLEQRLEIPRWPGHYDSLHIYKRHPIFQIPEDDPDYVRYKQLGIRSLLRNSADGRP